MAKRIAHALVTAGMLLVPSLVAAQQDAGIVGLVTDRTGAVLPGVTIEASSPALIEKVRIAVTDGRGLYQIVGLGPGVYSVTFTLSGFTTVKREGIELTVGFTATVNAELPVGDIEETITVAGESPLVDIRNVNQQRVITRDVLDSIPTGRVFSNFAALVPGVVLSTGSGNTGHDVGGATGFNFAFAQIHGSRALDQMVNINGMSVASLTGMGGTRTNFQDGTSQEYDLRTSAHTAEVAYGGVYANIIPKQGGNRFSGSFFANFTDERLQTNNLDADLRQRGLSVPNKVQRLVDVNPSFGGPILRDKLWFYAGYRYEVTNNYVGRLYYNKTPAAWVYTPDFSRPAILDQYGHDGTVNLTWQLSPKNKLTGLYTKDFFCLCHFAITSTVSPEASSYNLSKTDLSQLAWTATVTDRLLLEVGVSHYVNDFPRRPQPDATEPQIVEQQGNFTFRSAATYFDTPQTVDTYRASLTRASGANNLKVGFTYMWLFAKDPATRSIGDLSYRTLNGVPNQVTYRTTPYPSPTKLFPVGLFVQDQLTLKRWTINGGLRYDQFRSKYDPIHLEPVRWLPVARDYPGAEVLNWKDLSPRLSVSYDLFGSARTALKAGLSRYLVQEGKGNTSNVHPVIAATNAISRTWNDANRDFIVQGDPFNPAANGELGPSPNANFGKPNTTLRFDPAWAKGFGARPYNWETMVMIHHQLLANVALQAGYFRRTYGNFIVNDNALVGPSDFDPYCITAPMDTRLPGGGGYEICGLYDLNPTKVGRVDTVRRNSEAYGKQIDHWNGVDVAMNARLPNGVLIQGGVSAGKTITDNCDIVTKIDNPSTYNCHQESRFLPQAKFLWSYPLPWWDVQVSGAFQSHVPDPTGGTGRAAFNYGDTGLPANYVATNALIRPSLGRSLSSGANVTVNIVTPGTQYGDRLNQFDLRIAKTVVVGKSRVQALFDLYNVFNANAVLRYNPSYGTTGATWFQPQGIMPGRLVKFGGQLRF